MTTSGLDLAFAGEVSDVCGEIKSLLQMEETVERPVEAKDITAFLYSLSAFLLDLDCPYSEFSSGSLDTRFSDIESRTRLTTYLQNELKVAQLIALQRLENLKPDTVEVDEDHVLLCEALEAVGSTYSQQPIGEIFTTLYQEVDKRGQRFSEPPKVLFKASMDEEKWRQVDDVCNILTKDFRARTVLLLKRLDVSVNSFLWTDRLMKMEDEIRGEYARRITPQQVRFMPLQVWHLLAATDSILHIESASNPNNRKNTKCPIHPLATGSAPKDRGGRTGEQTPLKRETFTQQQHNRDAPRGGRGGGGRGRGHHGAGHGQHMEFDRRSAEHKTRDEYAQSHRNYGGGHQRRGGWGSGQ